MLRKKYHGRNPAWCNYSKKFRETKNKKFKWIIRTCHLGENDAWLIPSRRTVKDKLTDNCQIMNLQSCCGYTKKCNRFFFTVVTVSFVTLKTFTLIFVWNIQKLIFLIMKFDLILATTLCAALALCSAGAVNQRKWNSSWLDCYYTLTP